MFEELRVYDITFGCNLARLNLDPRHPDAGHRYAIEPGTGEDCVPRAEFTPTTPFCTQSDTLAKGSHRAWNGLVDRHEFDRVRVRVHPMHQASDAINAELSELESTDAEEVTDRTKREQQSESPPGGTWQSF